jgi:hypothetical protein
MSLPFYPLYQPLSKYHDPARLERKIDEEKQWLGQLTDSYVMLSHPHKANSRLFAGNVWQLKECAAGRG